MNHYDSHVVLADCLDHLRTLADASIDSIVTDPPYGISFMGKRWDCQVPDVAVWAECLRVLKPGGHLLAFAGTRTQHRMAVNIEDAGFEIRDIIAWVYGCLSEDTEILINGEWCHYSKAIAGSLALCYDVVRDTYSWQPVERLVVYDYDDTAFRIRSNDTDQIVSRNHRCLVERDGVLVFALAEEVAREQEARVPVLEGMRELLDAISVPQQNAGGSQQILRDMRSGATSHEVTDARSEDDLGDVLRVRCEGMATKRMDGASAGTHVLKEVQRPCARSGLETARIQGPQSVDGCITSLVSRKDDRSEQPVMEGRRDVQEKQGKLYRPEVCSVPAGINGDVPQGWVCHGASTGGGNVDRPLPHEDRVSSPRGPLHEEQRSEKLDAFRVERGSQEIRGARFTASTLARITPFHLTGKVWCVQVPTGAFVARRNGKVFVTGNSGFPKSLNVSKAITGPATDAAKQWDGWGTALKPALEPITVARKPLIGTVAENVLTHGTGALNIDGCRVETDESLNGGAYAKEGGRTESQSLHGGSGMNQPRKTVGTDFVQPAGRWPANLIHDGSDDVLAAFPNAPGQQGAVTGDEPSAKMGATNCFGKMDRRHSAVPRIEQDKSAARFFYAAKASKAERGEGNGHPTVKPVALMRYLVRLVTPPGGLVLDPFAGSGTTGIAAALEGFCFLGIEREAEYCEIARRRIAAAGSSAATR